MCQAQHAPFALRPRPSPLELEVLDRALSISVEQALRPSILLDRFPKSNLLVLVYVLQVGTGLASTMRAFPDRLLPP